MTWVQDQLDDETLFPSKIGKEDPVVWCWVVGRAKLHCSVYVNRLLYFVPGVPFPKNFLTIAKTILKRLFRVYAHIYHQHFSEVVQLGEEAHLNTSFKHFIFFVQVWNEIHNNSPRQWFPNCAEQKTGLPWIHLIVDFIMNAI
jgi:MOB kinase activator 1